MHNALIITSIAVIVLKDMQSIKPMENVNLLPLMDVTILLTDTVDSVIKGTFFQLILPLVLLTVVSSTVETVLKDLVLNVFQVILLEQ